MRKAGTAHTKSSNDMENHVYIKAKSRVSSASWRGSGRGLSVSRNKNGVTFCNLNDALLTKMLKDVPVSC